MRRLLHRLLGWYGANPLHLLALAGSFAVAGYAASRLVPSNPLGVGIWFLGAVVGHDLLLMPLYSLADWPAAAVFRRNPARPPAAVPWINYLRVPAVLSGLLLLVWFPLILRLRTRYQASTTLSPEPFLWHWLGVTGALFLLSAAALAVRIRMLRHSATVLPVAPDGEQPGQAPSPPVTVSPPHTPPPARDAATPPPPVAPPPPPAAGTDDAAQSPEQEHLPPQPESPHARPADDSSQADDRGTDPPAPENERDKHADD